MKPYTPLFNICQKFKNGSSIPPLGVDKRVKFIKYILLASSKNGENK